MWLLLSPEERVIYMAYVPAVLRAMGCDERLIRYGQRLGDEVRKGREYTLEPQTSR